MKLVLVAVFSSLEKMLKMNSFKAVDCLFVIAKIETVFNRQIEADTAVMTRRIHLTVN